MTSGQTVAELRELVYQEVLALFEGDKSAADRWLTSSVRGLGNHTPTSLMGTEPGIREVKTLVGQLEHGIFS